MSPVTFPHLPDRQPVPPTSWWRRTWAWIRNHLHLR